MAEENTTDELTLDESDDGSVVVKGLKGVEEEGSDLTLKDEKPDSGKDAKGDADDGDDEDESLVGSGGSGARSRSAKRRRLQQERRDANQKLIEHLAQQNQVLQQQLGQLNQRLTGSEIAQLDAALLDADAAVQDLQARLAKTVTDGDGQAHSQVLDALYNARQRLDQLANAREQADAHIRQQRQAPKPRPDAPQSQPQPQVDRRVINRAREWLKENDWYDPALGDTDSRIARVVDQEVKDEGFDPVSDEYYEELDRRLAERLPNVKKRGTIDQSQRSGGNGTGGARPRSIVSGSGRNGASGGGTQKGFTLSAERVKAMKDAGIWDNPEARNNQIKYYQEYDRAQSK
ncbi:hypothetical protein UFOVP435_37 [uncultured Caudovirales phage]|uniref:Uncharacterized protein n=1 Tax=uncultured Caudovirales phage TaxID=2100421 RepID=A0A6J5MGW0_9CAUD|nr:hypothetical protein UFOVP435_37 [uncultured Caudovirales phage]